MPVVIQQIPYHWQAELPGALKFTRDVKWQEVLASVRLLQELRSVAERHCRMAPGVLTLAVMSLIDLIEETLAASVSN